MALKLNTHAAVDTVIAGTRVQVDTSNILCTSVFIQAKNTNTGRIYVGDSSVSSSNGIELNAGEGLEIVGDVRNPGQADEVVLSDIWIDSSVNAEGVKVSYFIKRANGVN